MCIRDRFTGGANCVIRTFPTDRFGLCIPRYNFCVYFWSSLARIDSLRDCMRWLRASMKAAPFFFFVFGAGVVKRKHV